jgi:hypothetical protein
MLFNARLLGWRESRAQLGVMLPPERDDLFVQQMSSDLVPFAQLTAPQVETITVTATPTPPQLEAPDEPDEPKARKAPANQRTARALRRVRDRHVPKLAAALDADFAALAATVMQNLEASAKAATKELPTIEDLLPWDDWGLLTTLRAGLIELLEASWPIWNVALDADLAFEQSDPAVVAIMTQAAERIAGIQQTTREAVQDLLTYGASQGWSIDQLARGTDERRGLNSIVQQTYANRGTAIARTELGTGQNLASTIRYRGAGVTHVIVLDNGFDDSDPRCTELNGTRQTLEWAERNPLQHPNCVRAFSADV